MGAVHQALLAIPAAGVGGGGCALLPGVPTTNLQFDHVGACLTGADNDLVHTWVDSHSTANDYTQPGAAAPNKKTGILNGLSIARFAATPANMVLDVALTLSAFTYIAVIKSDTDTTGVTRQLITGSASGAPEVLIFNNKIFLTKSGIAVIGNSTTNLNQTDFYTIGVTYDGTNAAFYLNGVADGTASNAQTFTQNVTQISNGTFHGDLAEDLLWDAVLSGGDLTTVFGALQARWAHY